MRNPTHKLILHCQLECGRVVGETVTALPMTEDEYRAHTGIVDQRCSQCEIDHRTYRSLLETFKAETEGGEAEAEMFVVKHRKHEDFRIELDKEIIRREKSEKKMKGKV